MYVTLCNDPIVAVDTVNNLRTVLQRLFKDQLDIMKLAGYFNQRSKTLFS